MLVLVNAQQLICNACSLILLAHLPILVVWCGKLFIAKLCISSMNSFETYKCFADVVEVTYMQIIALGQPYLVRCRVCDGTQK